MTRKINLVSLILLGGALVFGGQMQLNSHLGFSQELSALKIEMKPAGLGGKRGEEPYKVDSKGYMRVIARNDTDRRVRVIVVDTYYQNRPELFKDGRLVSYREEVKKLIRSKDIDREFIRPGSVIFLEPYSSTDLEELDLSRWYGPLQPGSYRLINRHRFEVDGPWTAGSAELLFEVVP